MQTNKVSSPPAAAQNGVSSSGVAQTVRAQTPAEELPAFVPAPKSLVSGVAAAQVAAVNVNAVLTSLPKEIDVALPPPAPRTAILSLAPAGEVLTVGEKRKFAVELKSDVPLGMAMLALRFDPRVLTIRSVSAGSIYPNEKEILPSITQSIDPAGVCLISISALNGVARMKAGTLVFVEVEALAAGNAALMLDKGTMHVLASDARDITLEVVQGPTIVKQ
jgi:hypothetical protein